MSPWREGGRVGGLERGWEKVRKGEGEGKREGGRKEEREGGGR